MTSIREPKCRCGAAVKQVDLRSGPFHSMSGERLAWVHVDRGRDVWHQARLDWEDLADAD